MNNIVTISQQNKSIERNDMRVSSQWYHRPDDQRFTDLNSMAAACQASAEGSEARIIDSSAIRVHASDKDPDKLSFVLPGERNGQPEAICEPSHWSFGQTCGLVNAPASYMRKLPAVLAGINLQYGLSNNRAEKVKSYTTVNGSVHLRAMTGPDYGRIYDWEVVHAVQRIAGNGIGDTHWQVPGIFGCPLDEVTKENTTLYASDRDVFIFLVDEQHPIEIGLLQNGQPDTVYRGFYIWNSEVGSRSFGIATFLYRTVCQNRIIWGQRDFQEITFRHSKGAPTRFMQSVAPALEQYAKASTQDLITGINTAKQAIVAKTDDKRVQYLQSRGFTKAECNKVINAVLQEEGRPAESVWDMVQGITAVARDIKHQDARVALERRASEILRKVV
jgi:hypothetical protein